MINAKMDRESSGQTWLRTALFTTLFCVVIAFATQSVWGGLIYQHLMISCGFGYSAIFAAKFIDVVFPALPRRIEVICSLGFSMLFGTWNAQYWIQDVIGSETGLAQLRPVVFLGFIFTIVCFYYFYTKEQQLVAERELEAMKRKQSEQEKALVISQLKQLQSQIEPHFLFNTLATISVLIETDSDKAKLMLQKLTELLRATLNSTRHQQTTIEQEVALVQAYLEIQQVRLGQRLTFSIQTETVDVSRSLPPLLIQPLVENALTHGIEPLAQGGNIALEIRQSDDQIMITVSDNGAGFNPNLKTSGSGIGLDNIRQRITTLFGEQASMSVKEQSSGGVSAILVLPCDKLDG
ncbi:histidine kinase [Vibrio genomosp. F6]